MSNSPADTTVETDGRSEALSLPIHCPQCDTAGRIGWDRLRNGIRCPECHCEFIVTRGGRVVRLSDLRQVRYACPRCAAAGTIPALLATRQATCPGCKLPLALGPDQKLHGVREATELWATATPTSQDDRPVGTARKRRIRNDVKIPTLRTLHVVAVLAGIILSIVPLLTLFDRSPETLARKFTQQCLRDRDESVFDYLEDDAVQHVEFDRWKIRHFASILDRHRPDGDKMNIDVTSVPGKPSYRIMTVTLRSPFVGDRTHVQYWRETSDGWRFDARATLAAKP